MMVLDLRFRHDVQIAPARGGEVYQIREVEMPPKPAFRTPNALRHRPDFPPVRREDGQDAVGFAKRVAAQDDPLAFVRARAQVSDMPPRSGFFATVARPRIGRPAATGSSLQSSAAASKAYRAVHSRFLSPLTILQG